MVIFLELSWNPQLKLSTYSSISFFAISRELFYFHFITFTNQRNSHRCWNQSTNKKSSESAKDDDGCPGSGVFLTSTSSLGASCWCVRTCLYGSWWREDANERSTCGKSFCRSCTSGPKYGEMARWYRHVDGEPSEVSTLSGYCSHWECGHLQAVCQRRSIAADLEEFLPCLGF